MGLKNNVETSQEDVTSQQRLCPCRREAEKASPCPYANYFPCVYLIFLTKSCIVGIFSTILQTGKRRLRELKSLVQLCAQSESGSGSEPDPERSTCLSFISHYRSLEASTDGKSRISRDKAAHFPTLFALYPLPTLSLWK